MMTKDTSMNSELDRRISADLRARAQQSRMADTDDIEDSAYVENTEKTHKFTWVWLILIALAVLSLVCIVLI